MNFVLLIGRAGGDATARQTQNGKTVANFSLATSARKKDGTFEPTWHRIVAWEERARHALEVKKGDKVCVKGEISVREYEKNGAKERSFEIIAQEIIKAAPVSSEPQPVDEGGREPW